MFGIWKCSNRLSTEPTKWHNNISIHIMHWTRCTLCTEKNNKRIIACGLLRRRIAIDSIERYKYISHSISIPVLATTNLLPLRAHITVSRMKWTDACSFFAWLVRTMYTGDRRQWNNNIGFFDGMFSILIEWFGECSMQVPIRYQCPALAWHGVQYFGFVVRSHCALLSSGIAFNRHMSRAVCKCNWRQVLRFILLNWPMSLETGN